MKPVLLFTCCFVFPGAILAQKQLKQVTAWDLIEKDTVFHLVRHYDQSGLLLNESQPIYYCGVSYTYDEQRRVKTEDLMCGESSGNGLYTYEYNANLKTEYFTGPEKDRKTCTWYDEQGQPSKQIVCYKDYDQKNYGPAKDSTQYTYTFLKDQKGNIVSETAEYTYYSKEEGAYKPMYSECRNVYSMYDAADSLISRTVSYCNGRVNERTVYRYDPLWHLRTETYYFFSDFFDEWQSPSPAAASGFRHTVNHWDGKQLVKQEVFGFCDKKTLEQNESIEELSVFENGLIQAKFLFDKCSGQATETIHYTYSWW